MCGGVYNRRMNREIRAWLARYLRSEISLREFQDWFVPATWDVDAAEDAATRELAADVDLRLAEFTNGHLTEQQLRSRLSRIPESADRAH